MTGPWPNPLPCGQWLAPLIAQVADGVEGDLEHQASCKYCQQALVALNGLWEATAALAAEQVVGPDSIDRAVLRSVQREIFITKVTELIGGILPRLSRAFLVYSGLLGGGERR